VSPETPPPPPTSPRPEDSGASDRGHDGDPSRPSPYDALRPAGDGAARAANVGVRVSGPLGWLVNDVGLKVLALLLAFMLWHLVRGRIESTETAKFRVMLVPPEPHIRVVGGCDQGAFEVTLHGTRAEVDRVKSEFASLNVPVECPFSVDRSDGGRIGPITDPHRLDFPIDGAAAVISQMPAIEAHWVRVETRMIPFNRPEVVAAGRSDIVTDEPKFPDLAERVVEVEAPTSMFRGDAALDSLQPDPIDLRAWLADNVGVDFTTPVPFELSFDRWRAAAPGRGLDVVTIKPAQIKGKVRVYQRPAATLESGVRVLLAGSDIDRYSRIDVEIKSSEYDTASKRLKLDVRGDPKTVEALRAQPNDWSFAIALPPPGPGDSPVLNVKAPVFLWFRPDVAPPSIKLFGEPFVFVTLRKRD
jgi:hypothetical protein